MEERLPQDAFVAQFQLLVKNVIELLIDDVWRCITRSGCVCGFEFGVPGSSETESSIVFRVLGITSENPADQVDRRPAELRFSADFTERRVRILLRPSPTASMHVHADQRLDEITPEVVEAAFVALFEEAEPYLSVTKR